MSRKPHLLKENKGNRTISRVVYFDTESRSKIESVNGEKRRIHVPYLIIACFCDYRAGSSVWMEYHSSPNFIEEFWSDVSEFCIKGNNYLIAHNIAYDIINISGIPYLLKFGFTVMNYYEEQKVFVLEFTRENGKYRENIIALSSTNYFPSSLRELGDVFGLPKLEIDYEQTPIQDVIPYARRDVEIMKRAVESFLEFVSRENLGVTAKTLAGQAFNAFRHKFMNIPIFIHDNEDALMLERNGYYGGRVENWVQGKISNGKIYKLDVNSMYPYVMKNYEYPVKLVSVRNKITPDELKDVLQNYTVMAKCMIATDVPAYPVKLNDNLIFPVGTFVTYLSTPEVSFAIDRGHLIDVMQVAIYDKAPIFTSYVDYFYNKRLEAKKAGDKVHDMFYKLLMNSLYGKFGQKSCRWEIVGDADPNEIAVERCLDIDSGKYYTLKVFGGKIFRSGEEDEAYNSFPGIAAHVTAYARMLLWKYVETAGLEHIYYMDTDSLFVDEIGFQNLQKMGNINDTMLGCLKLEDISEDVCIYAPKDYQFGQKVKRKGVPANAKEIEKNTFELETWLRLSSFLRDGKLSQYYNVYRIKKLQHKNTKLWYDTKGKGRPIELETNGKENFVKMPDFELANPEQIKWVEQKFKIKIKNGKSG